MNRWDGYTELYHVDLLTAGFGVSAYNKKKKREAAKKQSEAEERYKEAQQRKRDKRAAQIESINARQNARNSNTGYKTEQQKRIEAMDEEAKIRNRIDNIIEQQGVSIKNEYSRILKNRAANNMSPIVWMPFKDYFSANIEERLERTGVDTDQRFIRDYIDSRCEIYYKEWAEDEVKRVMDSKKYSLLNTAKGLTGDRSSKNREQAERNRYNKR